MAEIATSQDTPSENQPSARVIYGVHAVRAREICSTQFITASFSAAEKYAKAMSRDPGVLAAAVTRHVVDAEGQHRAEALYVDGTRQQAPHVSNDRRINANGHGSASRPIADR